MSAPTFGWARIFWNSSGVSGPGFERMCSGHGELADVVQQRRGLHALDLVLAHPEAAGQGSSVELHAADVQLRGLVLRVDRERQRFDGRQVQVRHLLRMPALVVDAPEIDLVAVIREPNPRQRERGERHPLRRQHRDRADAGCHQGADIVTRRAPQEVLVPHLEQRLLHRQRDRRRDREGVEDEIGRGRAEQRRGNRDRGDGPGLAAEPVEHEARRLHGDDQARHAEQGAMDRVALLDAERALAERAGRRHDHRFVGPEEQQRRKVDRVRHRHRRGAPRQRQIHLEDRRDRREQQQAEEQPEAPDEARREEHRQHDGADADDGADVDPRGQGQRLHGCAASVVTRAGLPADLGSRPQDVVGLLDRVVPQMPVPDLSRRRGGPPRREVVSSSFPAPQTTPMQSAPPQAAPHTTFSLTGSGRGRCRGGAVPRDGLAGPPGRRRGHGGAGGAPGHELTFWRQTAPPDDVGAPRVGRGADPPAADAVVAPHHVIAPGGLVLRRSADGAGTARHAAAGRE